MEDAQAQLYLLTGSVGFPPRTLILLSGFYLILAVVSLIGRTNVSDLLLDIVVNAAVFICCLTPGIKTAFGRL